MTSRTHIPVGSSDPDRHEVDAGQNGTSPSAIRPPRLDRVVFGVAAVVVVAIIVWGLVVPDNLESVSSSTLN